MKTRTWVILIALVLAVSAGAALWQYSRPAPGLTANIYVDGVCVRSIDLSQVTQRESFPVESALGVNLVEVEPGRIRVLQADCPDQVCVQAGWLSDSIAPIVCLPHKLVIRLEGGPAGGEQIDGITQ